MKSHHSGRKLCHIGENKTASCSNAGPSGLLLAPAIWCVQFMRLAPRHGARKASYLLQGKVAEAFGALRYLFAMVRKGDLKAIYYK